MAEQIWVHVFCISNIHSSCVQDKELISNIDLTNIEKSRFQLKCHVCDSKNGACIQCHFGRCATAFHPTCGKDNFINTKDKTGFDDINCYCIKHKPLKLRKQIESLEKRRIEDILNFARIFERFEARNLKQTNFASSQVGKRNKKSIFSYDEKLSLIGVIEERIKKEESEGFYFWMKTLNSQKNLRGHIEITKPV